MGRFNISLDEDNSSYSSNSDFNYSYPNKQAALNSYYADVGPENQSFLLELNLWKKKYETDFHPGTSSFWMLVFNLSNEIVGSGILGRSYAMANTGIALFIILLTYVLMVFLYSVHLPLKTASEGGSLLYERLGHKAFGLVGKLAASGSITMTNIGAMSSYLFTVKYELPLVIQALINIEDTTGVQYLNGDYLVLLMSLVLILPLSLLRDLGYLGYICGLSLSCRMFLLIVVICKKFEIACPLEVTLIFNETVNGTFTWPIGLSCQSVHDMIVSMNDDSCRFHNFIFNSQTIYAAPILNFSFVCHPAILPSYEDLKGCSHRRMMNVSKISFFVMFLMYLLATLFGYLTVMQGLM